MSRIVVTGATGFVGRHTLRPLVAAGHEVHAVSAHAAVPPEGSDRLFRWHQVDLLVPGAAAALIAEVQPAFVLHLAWYTEPGRFWDSSENLPWVRASLELLHAFANCGGTRAVLAGTCAEYDWRYGWCSEQVTPTEASTFYGRCKSSLWQLAQSYAGVAGFSLASGRVFLPYGPYERPERLVAYVTRNLLMEQPALCSHGRQIRDLIHVQDLAEAFVRLTFSEVTGPVNLASGVPARLADVTRFIARQLNAEHLLRLDAREAPPGEPPILLADVRRLREEVGWTPTFDLEAGLRNTIEFWREQVAKQSGVMGAGLGAQRRATTK